MKLSDFHFELPDSSIAKQPLPRRDDSRLLVVERASGKRQHRRFRDLPEFLRAGDCLALNESRVLPVRFLGRRRSGARIEVLLVQAQGERCRAFVRGKGRVKEGETLELEAERIPCRLIERIGSFGEWWVDFPGGPSPESMRERGRAPLPPYIAWSRGEEPDPQLDRERYQTVFAVTPGSIAAPTAGLHFTPELLARIQERGVKLARLTLHVGPGTFLPVRCENIEEHRLLPERYEISSEAAVTICETRRAGGRVVAVGTTVTRVLESITDESGAPQPGRGETAKFIYPPYSFRAIDGLITNFHLPESTLLMLVSALLGRERCLEIYAEAVRENYRFFSYGDAMLILP